MRALAGTIIDAVNTFRTWLVEITRSDPSLRRKAVRTNLNRMVIICAVGLPVSLAHVALFWLYTPAEDPEAALWRLGIMAAHGTLALLELGFLTAGYHLLRQPSLSWAHYLFQYAAVAVVALAGAAISAIDQLVTPNMTPFLVAAVLIAVIFLIHPLTALVVYSGCFALFYLALGLTQSQEALLLSNRVNGLTAVGLGFSLSVMLWTSFLRRTEQQRRIEAQQRRLEALATLDPLTGLLNRRRFEETVATEVARLRRTRGESCLLLMDMDHFKAINDQLGHPAGDQVLRAVSAMLQQSLRRYDVVARWGGEEFIMLLPDTDLASGREVAEKLRQTIAAATFQAAGRTLSTTASFGLVPLSIDGDNPFHASYVSADAALYTAKHSGRNRVSIDDGKDAGQR